MDWSMRLRRRKCLMAVLLMALGFILPIQMLYKSADSIRSFTFDELLVRPGVLSQDDGEFLQYLRNQVIIDLGQYQKTHPTKAPITNTNAGFEFGQVNQSSVIDGYLKGKRSGFFIEAGAWNGEYLSNSLFFEQKRGWTGLLVEPNRDAFESLAANPKRSNASAVNGCLSLHSYPEKVSFDSADVFGGILDRDHVPNAQMSILRQSVTKGRSMYSVQCYPLYSLLLAMGNPTVDYFSLDVEGAEVKVLLSIPFDKVDIRTISVEVEHSPKAVIKKLMRHRGYKLLKTLKQDYIFVKEELPT